ncbi:Vomp family autotransporter [Bartonella tribocorum]|uniref:Vomp family autotransporter n=1 Tax=Bartonella tribocorum TaxID=85701 RepID=UPI001ABAE814|nr:Vomp family autotransporter [Bartonella tribocorum]
MNKLYTKLAGSELKFSRFPFIKVVSVTSIAALLSSVSPVFSKNIDSIEGVSTDIKAVSVGYPQSVISVYDDSLDVSKDNYITVSNTTLAPNAHVLNDNANFLTRTLSDGGDDNSLANTLRAGGSNRLKRGVNAEEEKAQAIINPQLSIRNNFSLQQFNQDDEDSAIINASDTSQNNLSSELQRDVSGNNVIFGDGIDEKVSDSVVIGSKAKVYLSDRDKSLSSSVIIGANAEVYRGGSVAIGADTVITEDASDAVVIGRYARAEQNFSTALGFKARGLEKNSIAIGSQSRSEKEDAISIGPEASASGEKSLAIGLLAKSENANAVSIGSEAFASGDKSMALGMKSQATVEGGVAIGAHSVAEVGTGITGYSPFLKRESEDMGYVWNSKLGAVSIGNKSQMLSRQITGVAAGKEDADAVNVAQLKSLQDYVDKGWKLSVNGNNGTVVGIDNSVDFAVGSENFKITASDKDSKVQFDLAKKITLDSVQTGTNTLDATGLVITGGPKITTTGISAGGQKITGVATGTDDTDAINKAQLDQDVTNLSGKIEDVRSVAVFYDDEEPQGDNIFMRSARKVNKSNVTFGDPKVGTVGLHNVGLGKVTADSTDAINGSQLYSTNKEFVSYLDGNASYDEEGKWKEPTFTLKTVKEDGTEEEQSYPSVAEAFAGVGTSFKNIQNKITNDITNQINETKGDALLWNNDKGAFVAQHGAGEEKTNSKITFIANGDITENSTDAINGSQLYSTNKEFVSYLDGNASYDEEGKWKEPTFTLKTVKEDGTEEEQSYPSVAEAFAGVGTSFKNIQNKITNDITNQINETKGDALLWNNDKGAFIAQHGEGEGKTNSKISFLANGDITENSTDAINGSQLYSMSNKLAAYLGGGAGYKDGEWKEPTFTLKTVKEDGTEEEQSYPSVAEAFAGVGTSFKNIQNKITNDITNQINETKGDALLWNNDKGAFIAQHGEGEGKTNSKITFLANGDITENSTDAINGSQLYLMSNKLAAYFGGGAGYKDGEWMTPKFHVAQFKSDGTVDEQEPYDNVAAAFDGISGSMQNINNRITEVTKNVTSNGLNWNEDEKAYDARHQGQDSKITHVANGKLSEDSKEAVNGSQLWETNNRVSKVEEKVDNIDQQVKNIENTVTNDAVKYDKNEKGDKINKVTLAGVSESDPVVLNNVADGRIESGSKEAVNGGQLHDHTDKQMKIVLDDAKKYTDERFNSILNNQMGDVINEAKSYTDMKFESLNYSIENVRKEARQAAAIGLAVSNLRYNETPGKLSVGFGTGLWRSQSAFAFGAGYTSESGSVLSNVSVTNSGGHWGIGAGFNMTLN